MAHIRITRGHLSSAVLVLTAVLAVVAAPGSGAVTAGRNGGTFRIASSSDIQTIDPGLAPLFVGPETTDVFPLTCLSLAEASKVPKVSRSLRTFTFEIRPGIRFNTGERVTARTFVATIDRMLVLNAGPADNVGDIVGAAAVRAGKAKDPSGLTVRGDKLTIRLTAGDGGFAARAQSICAVPAGLPADPEGARAPLPAAGRFFVQSWSRGRQVTLVRNPFFRPRPHPDRVVLNLNADPQATLQAVEAGRIDLGRGSDIPHDAIGSLAKRYGVNRARLYVKPTTFVFFLALNTHRSIFESARMRRAVNFAIDRRGLVKAGVPTNGLYWASPTDQWLVPGFPGYVRASIYPLTANLRKARALVGGRAKDRRLALYTRNYEPYLSQGQLVQRALVRLGFRVTTKSFPRDVISDKLRNPNEPWDVALAGAFGPDTPDPAAVITPVSYDPTLPSKYRRALARAIHLFGPARNRALGKLDVAIARNVALTVPYASPTDLFFVSARVGCKTFHPELDIRRVCLTG
jgi:peptide/nickel transport system substrate-binding protein